MVVTVELVVVVTELVVVTVLLRCACELKGAKIKENKAMIPALRMTKPLEFRRFLIIKSYWTARQKSRGNCN